MDELTTNDESAPFCVDFISRLREPSATETTLTLTPTPTPTPSARPRATNHSNHSRTTIQPNAAIRFGCQMRRPAHFNSQPATAVAAKRLEQAHFKADFKMRRKRKRASVISANQQQHSSGSAGGSRRRRRSNISWLALLVCCLIGFVCGARAFQRHIHQLDSNLINDGSISAIPFQKESSLEMSTAESERIDLRHNFTFRVNGRQLALEPPAASTGSGGQTAAMAVAVNRLGQEYAAADYESGFEPANTGNTGNNGPMDDQAAAATAAASNSEDAPETTPSSSGAASDSSSLMSGSSSSSSRYGNNSSLLLQLDQSQNRVNGQPIGRADHQPLGHIISDWPKSARPPPPQPVGRDQQQQQSQQQQPSNNVASEAAAVAAAAGDRYGQVTPDRHSSSNNRQPASQRKYSALLSTNELASQSGEQPEQRRWEGSASMPPAPLLPLPPSARLKQQQQQQQQPQPLTGRIKLTISSRLAQTIKTQAANGKANSRAANEHDQPSSAINWRPPVGASETSRPAKPAANRPRSPLKVAIRASKERGLFYSSAAADSGTDSSADGRPLSPATVASLADDDRRPTLAGRRAAAAAAAADDQAATGSRSARKTSSGSSSGGQELPTRAGSSSSNSTKADLAPTVKVPVGGEIPENSISEHKTNLSNAAGQGQGSRYAHSDDSTGKSSAAVADPKQRTTVGKSSIVQRDLRRIVQQQQQQQYQQPSLSSLMGSGGESVTVANRAGVRAPPLRFDNPTLSSGAAAAVGQASATAAARSERLNSSAASEQLSASAGANYDLLSGKQAADGADLQLASRQDERLMGGNSIVRTGSILPHPGLSQVTQSQLSALVPAAMALLAQAHEDQHSRAAAFRLLQAQAQLQQQQQQQQQRALGETLPPSSAAPANTIGSGGQQVPSVDQMLATANQMGVAHMGPQAQLQQQQQQLQLGGQQSGPGEQAGNYADGYPDRLAADANLQSTFESAGVQAAASNMSGDEQRQLARDYNSNSNSNANNMNGNGIEFSANGELEHRPYSHNQASSSAAAAASDSQLSNSRVSVSDPYHKSTSREAAAASAYQSALRSGSLDPFEELVGTDYERDLADLDEEFNRHVAHRRPATVGSGAGGGGESYVSLLPAAAERYEARRRRPLTSYADYADYLSAAGSMASIIPRAYPARSPSGAHWAATGGGGGGSHYSSVADAADSLWPESSPFEYLGPLMSPSTQYATAYRWRPARYHHQHHHHHHQRLAASQPYISAGASYLSAAASEQPPAGYSYLPAYSPANLQTETISFALSPLAAAAAAAASALAAADKSRHQSHAWLTLPRLAAAAAAAANQPGNSAAATGVTASASQQHSASLPAAGAATLPTAAFISAHHHHRPSYATFSPIPIYAFAPRSPQAATPTLTSAATGSAAAAMFPYFHTGAGPTLLAYRPAAIGLPPSSLLTAASFAYPFRLPIATSAAAGLGRSPTLLASPTRAATFVGSQSRPTYLSTDLQFAETKYKSNLNNNNNNNSNGSGSSSGSGNSNSDSKKSSGATSLSAMAKSLSKKVFGSASQLRPQHVAPPATTPSSVHLELYAQPNSSLGSPSQSIIK